MMKRDIRRIAVPENCISPNTYKTSEKIDKLVDENGIRNNKKNKNDSKPISLKVGIVPSVTGSAYMEYGNTKIICSVNGPRDVLNKNDSSAKGQLFCEFKYALFSCSEKQQYLPSDEELAISKSIQDALEPVVLLHKFPKSRLDISILILENDGGAIAAAITCAGAALSNAGVEMYDLPIGSELIYTNSQYLVDPTADEEYFAKCDEKSAQITIAMMVEYKSQVIFIDSGGYVEPAIFSEGMKILQSMCHQILAQIKLYIKHHVIEMNTVSEDQLDDELLNKKLSTTVKHLQPHKYISSFLVNNIRPDLRSLTAFRPFLINFNPISTAMGSALVRLGKTSVLCGMKAELTNPLPTDPDKGFFVPNVTLTSVCSNRFVPGPPTEEAQLYSQMIMDLWRTSNFVDPTELCVEPGKLSWCIFADMVCLSDDGNVLDACVLALMAALKHTKMPEVSVDLESEKIEVSSKECEYLKVEPLVFSATYAIMKDKAVADPTLEEEMLKTGSVITFLKDSEVNVHCYGSVSEALLRDCIRCSQDRYKFLLADVVSKINKSNSVL